MYSIIAVIFAMALEKTLQSAYVADCVRDYNNSFSGRGNLEDTWGDFNQSLSMEQALPAAMIVGTLVDQLLNANGDVVSAMLIEFRKKSGFQTR
jgi:hypothetical protein